MYPKWGTFTGTLLEVMPMQRNVNISLSQWKALTINWKREESVMGGCVDELTGKDLTMLDWDSEFGFSELM